LFQFEVSDVSDKGESVPGKIKNRVSELDRSEEFPRRFVPGEIDLSQWEQIEPLFRELQGRTLDSPAAVEAWLLDWSELESVIDEEGSRRYIAMTCATDDPAAEQGYLHFVEQIQPKIKPIDHQLKEKLVGCGYVGELDPRVYGVFLRTVRNQLEIFDPANVPLETEVDKLSQQYQKTMGAMTVEFRGREYTLQQMALFLEERDRSLRREAFDLTAKRRLQDTGKMEDIFDRMLELRCEIARNAGFDDFRAYQFRNYNRFDYTPEDCLRFHDAVEDIVVPLSRRFTEERGEALGVESVRPWDTSCDRYGRPPLRPFDDTDALAFKCREVFGKVDEELGGYFQKMMELGLLDLASRKGKAPGGYQTTLSEARLPFIFMNAVGINRDVFTLLHEGGHAFHTFLARHHQLKDYRHAPMEFCEVASMAMEHLSERHLEVFYRPSDAARARRDHLEGAIAILPWIAIVDAFQHWVYTHPDHNRDQRADYWEELMNRFGSGVDFTGYEDALRYRWHAQLHIFEYPFYYIEYGIALLGALQVWRNSLADREAAVAAYKSALTLGGSRPLPELFQTAGARLDFNAETIEPLMAAVATEIEEQASLESR